VRRQTPGLSACIEWLYAEIPEPAARIVAAGADGIDAVEFWHWRRHDVSALGAAAVASNVDITSFVSEPTGNLTDPATHTEFIGGLRESISVAGELGCTNLVVLAGDNTGQSEQAQISAVVAALREAAAIAGDAGMVLILEPLNTRVDHPDSFLADTEQAVAIVEAVGSEHLRLLFDVYHSAMMGEDPAEMIRRHAPWIGHVQVADTRGRSEPGTGDINWPDVMTALAEVSYGGRIGLEYRPRESTPDSLRRLREALVFPGLGGHAKEG
jgi:hydroxypyruvate isomerase